MALAAAAAATATDSEIGTNTSTTTTMTCISSSAGTLKTPETNAATTLQTEQNNNNHHLIVRTKDTEESSPPPPPLPKRNKKPKSQHEDNDSAIGIIEPFDDGDESIVDCGGYNTAPGGLFEKIFGEIFSRKNDESHNNCRDSQRSHTKLLHVFNVSTGQSKKHKKPLPAASLSSATASSSSPTSPSLHHPSKTQALTSNPFVVKHRLKGLRTSGSGNLFVTLSFSTGSWESLSLYIHVVFDKMVTECILGVCELKSSKVFRENSQNLLQN